jgi:hypothetical protein
LITRIAVKEIEFDAKLPRLDALLGPLTICVNLGKFTYPVCAFFAK